LRYALGAHIGLVIKAGAEVIFTGKNLGLVRQVPAAAINEIDTGEFILLRNFLRARLFLTGHRVIGAAFDRCVITDNHNLAPRHAAYARN